ncbi:glycosyltransferase family 4 protein [Patescibacteria group bacterium]|nr:glycosyltransferase family 4 protein [Patescibacteria group bacterium]
MIIGLEASRANKKQKTGTEWYAWHLFEQFKEIDQDNSFIIYHNNDLTDDLAEAPANFLFKQIKWPFRKFWTHICLSFELLLHPVDKLFFSNAVPLITRGEVIATIHDLGFIKNPELYHPLERVYQKVSHNIAIKRADKILAISEATKADIIKYYPKAESKIKVIYNGWDDKEFKPITEDKKQFIKHKYNLPDRYLLYIGRIETKKNIQNLVKGFNTIKDSSWPLVLAGRPGNYGFDEIKKLAGNNKKIIFLGYIPQEDYKLLIGAASIFVFPSKFEGFGIPILEAMGSGVPVLCSDIPVLHEVGGDAAVFFDPDSVEDIAMNIDMLIRGSAKRQELIKLGLDKSREFSWEKCAKETLKYILS